MNSCRSEAISGSRCATRRSVDPTGPQAIRAIEAARAIVPGELVDVSRDVDDADKWEVTLHAFGNDYEVELEPTTLALLRIDYD